MDKWEWGSVDDPPKFLVNRLVFLFCEDILDDEEFGFIIIGRKEDGKWIDVWGEEVNPILWAEILFPVPPYKLEMEYVCEWCHPSDIPEKDPEICRVEYCSKHGKVWFYPTPEKIAGEENAKENT